MARNYRQGFYKIKHPGKYKGDPSNIVFRSSWEHSFCQFCDNNPNIIEWASEELIIPYLKPTDGRVHRYFPDYWIKYKNKQGQLVQEVIEVKPAEQTRPPRARGKRRKTQVYESVTYAVNIAKWKAATNYCNKYGMKFRIITEDQLFK